MKMIRAFLLSVVLMAGAAAVATDTGDHELLLKQQREVEHALLMKRRELLKQDEELRDLNERIMKLQMQLARKLDRRPEIIELRRRLAVIEGRVAETGE
jgi:TolA-binding protein|tara:strand:- start:2977 stop:3273 length:297 start_codon:yes stop_codon:yes gene_type:complete